MILSMLEKLEQSLFFVLLIIKVNTNLFEKENAMYHKSVFIHTTGMKIIHFEAPEKTSDTIKYLPDIFKNSFYIMKLTPTA